MKETLVFGDVVKSYQHRWNCSSSISISALKSMLPLPKAWKADKSNYVSELFKHTVTRTYNKRKKAEDGLKVGQLLRKSRSGCMLLSSVREVPRVIFKCLEEEGDKIKLNASWMHYSISTFTATQACSVQRFSGYSLSLNSKHAHPFNKQISCGKEICKHRWSTNIK